MTDELKKKCKLEEDGGFVPNERIRGALEVHSNKFSSGMWKVPLFNKADLIPCSTLSLRFMWDDKERVKFVMLCSMCN